MTIQSIAKKQMDSPKTVFFGRKGTTDCFWFEFGAVRSYSDKEASGTRKALTIEELVASDWRVIPTKVGR